MMSIYWNQNEDRTTVYFRGPNGRRKERSCPCRASRLEVLSLLFQQGWDTESRQ